MVTIVYVLAGDQFLYRSSRGNITIKEVDYAPAELCEGTVFEQTFSANIQMLESISVMWGTYYRNNRGTVTIELLNQDSQSILIMGTFDASLISEGDILTVYSESPIENVYGIPLIIRLTSDSPSGASVAPMASTTRTIQNGDLTINGQKADGVLCFSAHGRDRIWSGQHYWTFVLICGCFLLAFLSVVWHRYSRGKHSYLINALIAAKKYRFLFDQLVARDFKLKYKRSILGVFWSFLNPLLTMVVQYVVFSTLFRSDIEYYPAYLVIGIVTYSFFSEGTGMCLTSIIANSSLITKVYMPKYIYPMTRLMSSVINLSIRQLVWKWVL